MRAVLARVAATIVACALVVACSTSPIPFSASDPPAAMTSPPGRPGIDAISAGGAHTCALTDGGGITCWGSNEHGELGDGTATDSRIPVAVSHMMIDVAAIAAGGVHTCVLTEVSGVKCWGGNFAGQLGRQDHTNGDSLGPVDVVGLASGVRAVVAGTLHTCALRGDGAVMCWGDGSDGQLGSGTTDPSSVPVTVEGLASRITAIAAGARHTCALTGGGRVTCWGEGWHGQLGNGTGTPSLTPVDVVGLSGVTAIAAGDSHTCALTRLGGVTCWGSNDLGELSNSTTDSVAPVDVLGLSAGVSAIASGSVHTCALNGGGAVKCWGDNSDGQLGNGSVIASNVPVDVSGLASGITAIAAGDSHTCALKDNGKVSCWGANFAGQLGNGSTTGATTPVDVDWATATSQ